MADPTARTASTPAAAAGAPRTGNARVDRMLQGMLGTGHLEHTELAGSGIALHFRADDAYFTSDEFIARLVIGAAFGLLHRCGLDHAVFTFVRNGNDVRLRVAKAAFDAFFALSAAQMARLASDPDRFEHSPVRNVTEARQWEFFLQFSKDDE